MNFDWAVTLETAGPGLLRITELDGIKKAVQIIRDPASSDDEWERGTSHTVWEMDYVAN